MTSTSSKSPPRCGLPTSGRARERGQIPTPSTFRDDEDGAVVAFTLFALLMMLIAGGIAIDVMRQEMKRAQMQNTLDSAVLAAAGAPFGTKPKAIVQDYMAKAGMSAYLGHIDDDGENDDDDIVQTLNASKVSATAHMSMDTYLMHMSGVKQLKASAASSAERRVPKLEVAMVLDVSGSMGSNSKLANLKTAGKKFVTSILDGSPAGHAVISVVPFSWDVAPGAGIFNALTVDVRQPYSSCLQFTTESFKSTAIDPDIQQTQLIYSSQNDNGFDKLQSNWRTCFTEDYAEILPYSISKPALHAKIDALKASGNTSGDMGMKWGAALLDPKFQSVKTALNGITVSQTTKVIDGITTTETIKMVDDLVGVVPAAYDEGETLKVIVMMGDGQNTYSNQFPVVSSYRGPDSYLNKVTWEQQEFKYAYQITQKDKTSKDQTKCQEENWICIYESVLDSTYYLYDPDEDRYLNLKSDTTIPASKFDSLPDDKDGFQSSEQLSWEMAWGMMSPDFLDKKFNYGAAESEFEGYSNRVQGWEKDTRMDHICTAIKSKGVVVYTIGFEIGVGGTAETELKKCATSQAHYYRAEGISITDAFNSIASNVVNLRLTQ